MIYVMTIVVLLNGPYHWKQNFPHIWNNSVMWYIYIAKISKHTIHFPVLTVHIGHLSCKHSLFWFYCFLSCQEIRLIYIHLLIQPSAFQPQPVTLTLYGVFQPGLLFEPGPTNQNRACYINKIFITTSCNNFLWGSF